ncbi:MAG: hypothetical protein LBV62_02505 [Rickettsiales bacterium]|jgi:hypothetical protein|nr:hypothetical protein [Rickettsiales bacterium]
MVTDSLTSSATSVSNNDSSWVDLGVEGNQEIAEAKGQHNSRNSGIEREEEFEVLGGKSQEIPVTPCDIPPEDLSLENGILANFPDGCNRSYTVKLKDEDLYDIIPKSLTFAEITNILNQAIKENNYEELEKIVRKIEGYEGYLITLDNENLKNFCLNQLNLDLQSRSDHQHIYSGILSRYGFDQTEYNHNYLIKELVLLAIAANDKLTEKYQDILFDKKNLSLLPLLVGGEKYISTFIGKFPDLYGGLKDKAIQLGESNKIGFFSVIALRKEQNLLGSVLVGNHLEDLKEILQKSKLDPLYGMLETASLIKNEEFITIVLNAFERCIDAPAKKDLLKKSFVTLLETAISQELTSVVKYLCERYINSKGCAIYGVYEQAFADDKVITELKQQILKNIGARGRREIYDLILKTALGAGNIVFIERLCKKCAECGNDIIGYLDQKLQNNEFDEIYESILIALSNTGNKDIIVSVLAHIQTHQNVSHNEQVIRQVIQNILRNATHYSTGQEDYSLVKEVCYLCTEDDAINEECGIFKSSIGKHIEDLEKENKLLQSEALRECNYNYLPDIVNGLAQTAYIVYDEYTKDLKYNKRQGLWDAMYQTPGTFITRKRSNNVADKLAIPVIKSDILSENPKPKSTDNQQPQKNTVDNGKNIMNNGETSTEQPIDNNYEGDKMHSSSQNTKSIKERLSDAILDINLEEVKRLVEQGNYNITELVLNEALKEAYETEVGKGDKKSKNKLKKIREFLEAKPKSIGANVAASPVGSSVGNISATTSGREILNSDDEEEQVPVQLTGSESQDVQPDLPSLSPQSSASGDEHSGSSPNFINVPTSSEGDTDNSNGEYVKVSPEDIAKENPAFKDSGSSQDTQPETSVPSPSASPNVDDEPPVWNVTDEGGPLLNIASEGGSTFKSNRSLLSPSPSDDEDWTDDEDDVPLLDTVERNSTLKGSSNPQDTRPKKPVPAPTPIPPVVNHEQVDNVSTSEQPSDSGKNNHISQNTKSSNLHIIAASALAIAGIALGVAIAVYLEMLAVGIAVGACCLVAAAVIYYCTPQSSVENSEVEKVDMQKGPITASV